MMIDPRGSEVDTFTLLFVHWKSVGNTLLVRLYIPRVNEIGTSPVFLRFYLRSSSSYFLNLNLNRFASSFVFLNLKLESSLDVNN